MVTTMENIVIDKPDILSMTKSELCAFAVTLGDKAFRGDQIYSWLQKGVAPAEMKNLPAALREKLAEQSVCRMPKIAKRLESKLDGTVKYLMEMIDGELVESVFMRYEHGNTVCVSCQAGCRMGCRFCASTLKGKNRDLTASEILGQIAVIGRDTGERVGGIVMMGIGEPLDNYDNTVKFLHLVSDPDGLNIGLRHISVSTCGLAEKIYRLADEKLPVTLSLSLHASDDETRGALMPVNNKYKIAEVLDACRYYFNTTGRRVSFEYTLIDGKNDGVDGARALATLLHKSSMLPCHVNLIMLNPVDEISLSPTAWRNAEAFRDELCRRGINATIRRRLGSDINASCGQLRLGNTHKN